MTAKRESPAVVSRTSINKSPNTPPNTVQILKTRRTGAGGQSASVWTHPGCSRRQSSSDRVSYRVIRRKRGRAVWKASPLLSPSTTSAIQRSGRATPLSRYRAIGSNQLSLTE
ncbi:hypothetical protein GOODEAATRI_028634 [Goodea atripinnis]|uniref:Uncharacterized protein n=1 Tax=Goodea atripinnis TaxID=208336 RepID=A0ABV0P8K9_9TELE